MRGSSVTPIAIVGMACRLPGGIDSPGKLWEALLDGADLITEVPADRWDVDEYYDPKRGVPGRSISRWGAFLDEPSAFDATFFGLDEAKAAAMDPQHRLLMETSWEAIEHAGIDPTSLAGSSTGVYLGLSHDDHTSRTLDAGAYGYTETAACMASGRVAYNLNVNGPALTFDTACSSGLLAVHMACRGLDSGEADLALAGGCMVMSEPRKNAWASAQGMLSPTGRCKAFDESADGFVRSEGCAVLLLKRLPDALRDGDRILAVVRGTAANSDGRTRNIATPSKDAQVAVSRTALTLAGVDPNTIGAVEAHGTGTPVGDPIEFGSLATTYGKTGTVLLGSVKSNLGHTEAAAGAVGLIKAVLELQHGMVPPMVHFNRLPEKLAKIDTGLTVPREATGWPEGHGDVRRIALASYGISGTNVHAILEQAPQTEGASDADHTVTGPMVFALSATSAESLRRTADRLADWVQDPAHEVPLTDLAHTLARHRGHRPVRTGVIAADRPALIDALRAVAGGDDVFPPAVGHGDRGPVWVFSGQGSQWAGMGAGLMASEPAFADTIAELEPLIAAESGFSVTEAILDPQTVTGIDRIQPSIFAMQVAMAAAMASHGVRPGAVIGQSLGEVAAAVVAGALSLHDGVKVICRRSLLCKEIAGGGAMATVEMPARQVRAELEAQGIEDVSVAVIASPTSTVIGGAVETVRRVVADWEQRDIMAREIAVDVASHTPHVEPVLEDLGAMLGDITPMTPEVPYYSATLFDAREQPHCDAEYWLDNLRYTVRFSAAVQTALEDGFRVFAELAPHPVTVRAIDQIAAALEMPAAALAGLRRGQELPHGLRTLLVDLYASGAAVDLAAQLPAGRLVDAPLPAWTHRTLELVVPSAEQKGPHLVAAHPLLGAHVRLLDESGRHVWQAGVATNTLPWLADHRIDDVAAMPAAAFCEMALAAAHTAIGDVAEVWDIRFDRTLEIAADTSLFASAMAHDAGAFDFEVLTGRAGERERLAAAVLHAVDNPDDDRPADYDLAALTAALPERIDGAELRAWFEARGLACGPAFAALTAVNFAGESGAPMLAEFSLPSAVRDQLNAYCVHPALLDACFQSVAAHPGIQMMGGRVLPLGVRRLRSYGAANKARFCVTRVVALDASAVEADLHLLDADGAVLLAVEGLSMVAGEADHGRLLDERLLGVEWSASTLPALSDDINPGAWLLVNMSDSADLLASELTDALKLSNADVTTLMWPHNADDAAQAAQLTSYLAENAFGSMVVVSAPRNGCPPEQVVHRGADHVRHMVRITRELAEVTGEAPRLYVVTRNAQTVLAEDRPNLEQGGLRGLLRSIGAEHPHLRATQIDVDESTLGRSVAHQLLLDSAEDETAFRRDQWFTARLTQAPLQPDERCTTVVDHERDGMRLEIRTPGDLRTLEMTAFERVAPGPGQIEVAVTASSVNFTDVLAASGRLPGEDGQPQLGSDFAGVITAVGPGVTAHHVGDHVGGISPNGCWGTFITCDADLAVALPRGLRDDQAAAVTTATATAWHGLHDLARIKAGDKVLIHSATGGVGQAAIAIAKSAGAEIFATAGSEERRDLLRSMGIEHVYDSRSAVFGELIRRDTDGYGVDIVLNSLTGAGQKAGMELLAAGGRFVEIGKADGGAAVFPFRRNVSFYCVDLALMSATHPGEIRELLNTVYRLVAKRVLPKPETTHYTLSDAATALAVMGAAEHTGKLILSVPRVGHSAVVVPPEQARVFRADGSYIVTGGLGGLGLFLAAKMSEAGCGRIVLNSRSAPKPAAMAEIDRMREMGTEVEVVTGDIADASTVDRLVAEATASGLPVRGVLHAAAVVEDAILTNITGELVERDWAPKVYGAWQLHRATATQPLDWFCSFSSAAALIGSPGQGAYAAANSWLDAFTQWRRAQGLPASAVAWAAWDEIGAGKHLAASGTTAMIDPEEGAYAFEALLRHDRAYAGYSPVAGAPWLSDLAARTPFGEAFAGSGADQSSQAGTFRAELHALPREEWPTRVRRLVAEQVGLILRSSVDPDRPITEYGLDSLGNLELRTRLENETGVRVRSMDITTVRGLADTLCESLVGALPAVR